MKPPIGVMPEVIWKEQRAKALLDAMSRYLEAGMPIEDEWQTELSNLIDWLNSARRGRSPKKRTPPPKDETLPSAEAS